METALHAACIALGSPANRARRGNAFEAGMERLARHLTTRRGLSKPVVGRVRRTATISNKTDAIQFTTPSGTSVRLPGSITMVMPGSRAAFALSTV